MSANARRSQSPFSRSRSRRQYQTAVAFAWTRHSRRTLSCLSRRTKRSRLRTRERLSRRSARVDKQHRQLALLLIVPCESAQRHSGDVRFHERGHLRDFGLWARGAPSVWGASLLCGDWEDVRLRKVGSPSARAVIGAERSAVRVPATSAPRPAATQRADSSSSSAEVCLHPSGRSSRTSSSPVQTGRRRMPCPTIAHMIPGSGRRSSHVVKYRT